MRPEPPGPPHVLGFLGSQGPMAMKPDRPRAVKSLAKILFDGICFYLCWRSDRSDYVDSSARPHLERIPAEPQRFGDFRRDRTTVAAHRANRFRGAERTKMRCRNHRKPTIGPRTRTRTDRFRSESAIRYQIAELKLKAVIVSFFALFISLLLLLLLLSS